ncbi:hypothetical protein DH2020_030064 [Rehmannia glutinosa]|uniref:GATA-type domain-containing protein n=1 Tax=Rehmannia glutinosa TaxID=99300 RepID=A0ABR0VNF4_REHGL
MFGDCDPFFSDSHVNSDLSAELSVPYEDIVQLEWLSTLNRGFIFRQRDDLGKDNLGVTKESSHNQFQTSSPVSVLESSSSSSSGGKTMPSLSPNHRVHNAHAPEANALVRQLSILDPRFNSSPPRPPPSRLPRLSPDFLRTDNFAESTPVKKIPKRPETPQWRAGPMGPKTLCNACGVRYKSGRLFPEYRPAASPTFIPYLHSNSHKKVVEMRSKVGPENAAAAATTQDSEVVPNA